MAITKLIFLDVDGVLINYQSLKDTNTVHPDCITNLNWLTDQLGDTVGIVVSSTWRKGGHDETEKLIREWGITGQYVGITPVLDRVTPGGAAVAVERGHEIQAFLDTIPEVKRFVILDDDADMAHLGDYLVRTRYEDGLTRADAEKALGVLSSTFNNHYAEFRNEKPDTLLQVGRHKNGFDFEMSRDDDLIESMCVTLTKDEAKTLAEMLNVWIEGDYAP